MKCNTWMHYDSSFLALLQIVQNQNLRSSRKPSVGFRRLGFLEILDDAFILRILKITTRAISICPSLYLWCILTSRFDFL